MDDHAIKVFIHANSKSQVGFYDSYETGLPLLRQLYCMGCEFFCFCQLEIPVLLRTERHGEKCAKKKQQGRIFCHRHEFQGERSDEETTIDHQPQKDEGK